MVDLPNPQTQVKSAKIVSGLLQLSAPFDPVFCVFLFLVCLDVLLSALKQNKAQSMDAPRAWHARMGKSELRSSMHPAVATLSWLTNTVRLKLTAV